MRVLILGGGISGLSAAWFLKRKNPHAQITLLEKTDRLGGWIATQRENGYLQEKGPRTFSSSRSPMLLNLIEELDLGAELIFSDPHAAKRYLWKDGQLRSLASFWPLFLPALIREPFIKPKFFEDESIYDFASRRLGVRVAETLFDPMTLGIYAGDIRKLSLPSCFPKLADWEKKKGSIIKGLFSEKKKKKRGLFTLKKGMASLIERLHSRLDIEILFEHEVEELREGEVVAKGQVFSADQIFCALPAPAINRLLSEEFLSQSISVVNLIYPRPVLPKAGYGYLIPSQEKQSLLGMIWDSAVFPQQNKDRETRLTAMVRFEEPDPVRAALQGASFHLNIREEPNSFSLFQAQEAIPQYVVGHSDKVRNFEKKKPSWTFLGNYLEGVSVEACIHRSFKKIII